MTSDPLFSRVRELARKYLPEIIRLRRDFHRFPELAFGEVRTSREVARTLDRLGFEVQSGINKTGLIGTLRGQNENSVTYLRADMDALPIREENEFEFISLNPGVMHACGHDAHTSSLLGAAMILADMQSDLGGTIRVLFQPSEEKLPGGAPGMIEEGALAERLAGIPTAIFGQHVAPELESGLIGVRSGAYMASTDEIYITVKGEGGHAAEPHKIQADAVLAASHVVVALQSVISRHCPPDVPSVLSFGKMIGDGATNILPGHVRLEGTFRSFNEDWRFKAHDLIRRVATGTSAAQGASCEIEILVGYPMLVNDPEKTAFVKNAAVDYVGKDRVIDVDKWFASEDFAYYLREVPGTFFRLGTGNSTAGITHALHTPRFTVDEPSLETGAGFLAVLALLNSRT